MAGPTIPSMKRLALIATLVLAACGAPAAHAADGPVTILLAGGPGEDVLDVKLSQDGRSYLIDSLNPLEASGGICAREEGSVHALVCEATAVAGFEAIVGGGNDSVIISPKILVPSTLRGGPGNDRLRGGGGADKVLGGSGNDSLLGHGGNDWLIGEAGADWLFGGAGEDRLTGGPGEDYLNGGPGEDTVELGPKDHLGPPIPS
jgi:Ca2+-binding RTX toxin-like protein